MHLFIIFTSFLASLVAAATSSASSASSSSSSLSTVSPTTTLVWVTGTNSAGVTATTESAYTQQFSSFFVSVAQPSSGEIGLGSSSGTVGEIRTYTQVTVNGAGKLGENMRVGAFTTFILPLLSAVFGVFML